MGGFRLKKKRDILFVAGPFFGVNQIYSPRAQEVIFVSFFLRPAALKMLAVAPATSALFALQAAKINLSKFHLSYPRGV